MADIAPVIPPEPKPEDPVPPNSGPAVDDIEALGEAVAEEFLATRRQIQEVRELIQPAAEPLAPIVNVQSAVPAITVSPADNPAPIVNVETAAPVINVMPAAAPSFNFHADSASVGFDIATVAEPLVAMAAGQLAGNEGIQAALMAVAKAMDLQTASITRLADQVAAQGRALLAPRRIVTDAAGKPIGVTVGD